MSGGWDRPLETHLVRSYCAEMGDSYEEVLDGALRTGPWSTGYGCKLYAAKVGCVVRWRIGGYASDGSDILSWVRRAEIRALMDHLVKNGMVSYTQYIVQD